MWTCFARPQMFYTKRLRSLYYSHQFRFILTSCESRVWADNVRRSRNDKRWASLLSTPSNTESHFPETLFHHYLIVNWIKLPIIIRSRSKASDFLAATTERDSLLLSRLMDFELDSFSEDFHSGKQDQNAFLFPPRSHVPVSCIMEAEWRKASRLNSR